MTHPLDCICPECAQMARIWADQAQAQTLELMQVLYGVRGVLGEIAGMCDRLSQKIARSQGVARSAIRRKPPKPPATPDRRKEVARIAGLAAQASGRAHRFNSETSKAASAKRTRPGSSRMAEIGRLGGLERGRRKRERRQQQTAPPPETPPPSPETPPPSPETPPPDHR